MSIIDRDSLLTPRLGEDDVELPNGLGTVRVRALSRSEVMRVQKLKDRGETDVFTIALGLVDPQMSVDDVRQWAKISPAGEMEIVSRRIAELSGIVQGADKSSVAEVPEQP